MKRTASLEKDMPIVKTKHHHHYPALYIVMTVIFFVYIAIIFIPYVYGIAVSLESNYEYATTVFPTFRSFHIDNYGKAWTDLSSRGTSVLAMLGNSLWFALGSVIVNYICSTMVAYVCAKYQFPGRRFIHGFSVVTMMIPIIGAQPARLQYLQALGGYDSPLYVLVMASAVSATFIIIYSCFKSIDWGYAEAAFIDGASHFTIFLKVMVPQIISPLSALMLSDFISGWANTDIPLIFFPDLPTLASGLFEYQKVVETNGNYPVYYAGLLMCMIPTIILFTIFHNKLMDVQIGGGLKG